MTLCRSSCVCEGRRSTFGSWVQLCWDLVSPIASVKLCTQAGWPMSLYYSSVPPAPFHYSSARIIDVCHHVWLFVWLLRHGIQVTILFGKHFYPLNHVRSLGIKIKLVFACLFVFLPSCSDVLSSRIIDSRMPGKHSTIWATFSTPNITLLNVFNWTEFFKNYVGQMKSVWGHTSPLGH